MVAVNKNYCRNWKEPSLTHAGDEDWSGKQPVKGKERWKGRTVILKKGLRKTQLTCHIFCSWLQPLEFSSETNLSWKRWDFKVIASSHFLAFEERQQYPSAPYYGLTVEEGNPAALCLSSELIEHWNRCWNYLFCEVFNTCLLISIGKSVFQKSFSSWSPVKILCCP